VLSAEQLAEQLPARADVADASQQAPRLIDGVLNPVVVTSATGRILHLNSSCAELLGRQGGDDLGQPFASLFASESSAQDADALVAELLETASGGQWADHRCAPVELEWRLPDGSPLLLAWTGTAIGNAEGAITALVFNGVRRGDVAEMAQRLDDAELRSRAIADASADCILLVGSDGLIQSVNPPTERLFGYSAAELYGGTLDIFLDYRDDAERDAWLDHVLYRPALGRRGSDNEFTARRRDGRRFPCDLSVAALELGGRHLYTVVMRNATERRRAEQEMARMRLDLKSIIDSMPSVLVGVDCNCAITAWNKEAYRSTGVPARQAMGRPFKEFFPHLETYLGEVREAVQAQCEVDTRRIALQQDGQLRHLEVMVYPLMARGSDGAVIRVDDVSSRVRLEQTMVQTEKMVSVGGLAAGMAHEINNPLGAITQSAQNLERRLSPDLPRNQLVADSLGVELADVRRYLEARGIPGFIEAIREGANRAAHIVTDMLNFSRTSDSKRRPESLNDMVKTALRLAGNDYELKRRYHFRHVTLSRSFAEDLPTVTCDATGIEQVVLNLVRNAAQAMTEADTTDPSITLQTSLQDDMLQLMVEDNGPGMTEATRKRAFEPFFTTKDVGVGTGLGLSVSYFIIAEQHGGSLSVASSPGKGTRFTLRLPLDQPDQSDQSDQSPAATGSNATDGGA
jgi:PAS domain S-box-containing protein